MHSINSQFSFADGEDKNWNDSYATKFSPTTQTGKEYALSFNKNFANFVCLI